mgnify:CR=1 FL=1
MDDELRSILEKSVEGHQRNQSHVDDGKEIKTMLKENKLGRVENQVVNLEQMVNEVEGENFVLRQ